MNCILSNIHDAQFNLASEEFLLKESSEDFFMLYRNEPAVIVGKHQNTLAEINHSYLQDHGIGLARRLSGGGTVYHDLGNLNFLFIHTGEEGKLVDFKRFLLPIQKILVSMGLPVEYGGRNDLLINGQKISGNAEHVFRKRILHHGTLLFSSDLSKLENVLRITPGKYKDKAVQSVRSKVTNISEHLEDQVSVENFTLTLFNKLKTQFDTALDYSFSSAEINKIEILVEKKYGTWKWNYGYSPDFDYVFNTKLQNENVQIIFRVQEGHIVEVISNNSICENSVFKAMADELTGKVFYEKDVLDHMSDKGLLNS